MDSFEKSLLKITTIVTISIGLITYVFDPRISIGFVLGCMCGQLSFMMMSVQLSAMLKAQHFSGMLFGIVFVVRLACNALPLLLSVMQPDKCNVWAVFAGLIIHKGIIYILGFVKEDANGN